MDSGWIQANLQYAAEWVRWRLWINRKTKCKQNSGANCQHKSATIRWVCCVGAVFCIRADKSSRIDTLAHSTTCRSKVIKSSRSPSPARSDARLGSDSMCHLGVSLYRCVCVASNWRHWLVHVWECTASQFDSGPWPSANAIANTHLTRSALQSIGTLSSPDLKQTNLKEGSYDGANNTALVVLVTLFYLPDLLSTSTLVA